MPRAADARSARRVSRSCDAATARPGTRIPLPDNARVAPAAARKIAAHVVQRAAAAFIAKASALFAVAWFVVFVVGAFAKPAAVVVRPRVLFEALAGTVGLIEGAHLVARYPLFASIIIPVIQVVSVSSHCIPP